MNIKVRLALMNFLEFAVWGAYLTSMGNYLAEPVWVLRFLGFMRYRVSCLSSCLR